MVSNRCRADAFFAQAAQMFITEQVIDATTHNVSENAKMAE
jgi:hypothetical protein